MTELIGADGHPIELPEESRAKNYRTIPQLTPILSFMQRRVPLLTYWKIEEMLLDPDVKMALRFRKMPIRKATLIVKSPDQRVRMLVATILHRLWTRGLNKLLKGFEYGFSGLEVLYETIPNGGMKFSVPSRFRDFWPLDTHPLTCGGELVGMRLRNVRIPEAGTLDYFGPQKLWFQHDQHPGTWFGRSVLRGMQKTYEELSSKDAARDSRFHYYYRHAFRGPIIRYPLKSFERPQTGGGTLPVSGRDIALEMATYYKNGSAILVPDVVDPTNNRELFRVEFPTQSANSGFDIRDYVKDLGREVSKGGEVPEEMISGADSGALAARRVPERAYYTMCEDDANEILEQAIDQLVEPLVLLHFGEHHARYDISVADLVPEEQAPDAPNQAPPQNPNQPGTNPDRDDRGPRPPEGPRPDQQSLNRAGVQLSLANHRQHCANWQQRLHSDESAIVAGITLVESRSELDSIRGVKLSHGEQDGIPDAFDKAGTELLDAIAMAALAKGLKLAKQVRLKLQAVLQQSPNIPVSKFLQITKHIIESMQPELNSILRDTIFASWVQGAARVADKAPRMLEDVLGVAAVAETTPEGFATPPIFPPPESIEGFFHESDPPRIRFPAIDQAIKDLQDRGILQAADFYKLADQARTAAFTVSYVDSQEAIAGIRDLLTQAVAEGKTLSDFKHDLNDQLAGTTLGDAHVETVFRNNLQAAFSAGQEKIINQPDVISAFPYASYDAIEDTRIRPTHHKFAHAGIPINGVRSNIFRSDDPIWAKWTPPNGHRCFLPETKIQGKVYAASKAFYSGKAVKILTRSGNSLSVTANHPILTPAGFVAAGNLRKGDHAVRYGATIETGTDDLGRQESAGGVSPPPDARFAVSPKHEQNKPSLVEDVFGSLAEFSGKSRVNLGADDLHGDGRFTDGKIDIVAANSELRHELESGKGKSLGDLFLAGMRMIAQPLSADRLPDGDRFIEWDAAHGSVRGIDLASARSGIHPGPFHFFSIGPAADLDAGLNEANPQNAPVDTAFAGQLLERFSGAVSLDEIVEIREFDYAGQVFDLSAVGGWLVADGLFASNCRCGKTYLTLRQAARMGIQEAIDWLETGVAPANPWFTDTPLEPDPGWAGRPAVTPGGAVKLSHGAHCMLCTAVSGRGYPSGTWLAAAQLDLLPDFAVLELCGAKFSVMHAPPGGIWANGKHYLGGMFIPSGAQKGAIQTAKQWISEAETESSKSEINTNNAEQAAHLVQDQLGYATDEAEEWGQKIAAAPDEDYKWAIWKDAIAASPMKQIAAHESNAAKHHAEMNSEQLADAIKEWSGIQSLWEVASTPVDLRDVLEQAGYDHDKAGSLAATLWENLVYHHDDIGAVKEFKSLIEKSPAAQKLKQHTEQSAATHETKQKRSAPGSQLTEEERTRLRHLGMTGTFPPADVPRDAITIFDGTPEQLTFKPLMQWNQVTKSGRVSRQYRYTEAFHTRNAAQKFDRVMKVTPFLKPAKDELAAIMADPSKPPRERDAAAIASIIAETGLRPTDGDDSVKYGHFGIASLQRRHVTIHADHAALDFIGKEGVRNRTIVREPHNIAALKEAVERLEKADEPLWTANSTDAGDLLKKVISDKGGSADVKLKDLRTIKATQTAEEVVARYNGPPPPLTGNKTKDVKAITKAILAMSGEVAKVLNNTPTQARDNYIHPKVFEKWQKRLQAAMP